MLLHIYIEDFIKASYQVQYIYMVYVVIVDKYSKWNGEMRFGEVTT